MTDIVDGFLEAKGVDRFALYLMDYGAPIGYRVFAKNPERVSAFIIQNGNAYEEGLLEFWDPIKAYWQSGAPKDREALRKLLTVEATEWQYTHGQPNPALVSPDAWVTDQYGLDRPGNQEIQLDMFYDYRTNVSRYPDWQALFRQHQPPTLIVWGKNDYIFPEAGAHPYKRDLEDLEFHLLDGGHFVLESHSSFIAAKMLEFLDRELVQASNWGLVTVRADGLRSHASARSYPCLHPHQSLSSRSDQSSSAARPIAVPLMLMTWRRKTAACAPVGCQFDVSWSFRAGHRPPDDRSLRRNSPQPTSPAA